MKIGILTFWWSQDNYGQLLQCYALQKYLRDLGHDAFIIRYNSDEEIKKVIKKTFSKVLYKVFNPLKVYKFIYYRLNCIYNKKKLNYEQIKNPRYFDEFIKKYIVQSEDFYKSYYELKENPPKADCYIVGSDQVWNNRLQFISCQKAYLLDFGSEHIKRISYAASWGRLTISQDEINSITPLLQKFNAVSVREKSGIELCKQCGNESAKWVCDPTILLTVEKYRELYKSENVETQKNKYLLFYMLNNECDFDKQNVFDFANGKNLEVVYVTGNGVLDNHNKTYATIPQWLSLVDNAEYVITNSFHCCVFSILFNKKFGVIPLTKNAKEMNSRFDSLFEIFGMEQRFIKNDFKVLEKEYQILESDFIQVSKDFINETLKGGKLKE